MTKLKARFDGRVLIPEGAVDLPRDRVVELRVVKVEDSPHSLPKGHPALILQMLDQPPRVTSEDVDALERAIEEGKLPLKDEGIFDEEQ